MQTKLTDNRHVALIHASNWITHYSQHVYIVEIMIIANIWSWMLRRRSWMTKGEEVRLHISKTNRKSYMWLIASGEPEGNTLTSFINHLTSIVVDQTLKGLEAFEWKWLYIVMIYYLSILTKSILAYYFWVSNDLSHGYTVCFNRMSTIVILPCWQSNAYIASSFRTGSICRLYI